MNRTPRAAIVGAGLMGGWHAYACRRAGGRVAAVIDVDAGAAARVADAAGCLTTAASLDALSGDVELDVVHVCTPPDTHVEETRRALARGCHVIVEKPLAPSAAATESLIAAARDAGRWLLPVHQAACQVGVREAASWLRDATLRLFDYRACSAGADADPSRADAVAAEILPHPLALVDVLLPGALDTLRWSVDRTGSGELAAGGAAGTAMVRLFVSMHARPPRHELWLYADRGTLAVDLFHGYAWRDPGGTSRSWKIARPFASAAAAAGLAAANLGRRVLTGEPAYPGLTALVREAYEAIEAPDRKPFSDEHVLAVARARDRILEQVSGV